MAYANGKVRETHQQRYAFCGEELQLWYVRKRHFLSAVAKRTYDLNILRGGKMDWQDKISGCFGSEDKKFALHSCELVRAAELLVVVLNENVTWPKFEKAVRENLSNGIKNKNSQKSLNTDKVKIHIDEQMEQVRKLFAPWLE